MTGQMAQLQIGPDLLLLLPALSGVVTGVLALASAMLQRPRWAFWTTVLGLLVAGALAIPLLGHGATVFLGTYRIDALSTWAALVLLPATALVAALAEPEIRGTDREAAVYSLLAFTTTGALVLAGAGDMLLLVLGVLISSLGAFGLVAYRRDDRGTEAAMKYFVFGSVSEAVMIFGLTFWFGAVGSTLLTELSRLEGSRLPALAGLAAVLVGLGYKAAVTPFHFWAPDAYDGAPTSVAGYVSVVPKVGAIFALAQTVRDLPDTVVDWRLVIAIVAVLSMTFGNLAALAQSNVVRLLAYSSIAQAGYFLLGVVALGRTALALQALIVFAAAYAAMNLGAFAIVLRVGRDLAAFSGYGRLAPLSGASLVIFLLSLVGVPPLAGFFGKLLLFGGTLDAGFGWLAVVAIVNSVLSLAVYLRWLVPCYQTPPFEHRAPSAGPMTAISAGLVVGLGLGVQLVLGRIG
jgi:proton-translocating NADH-quinone oxidoreductase chain N